MNDLTQARAAKERLVAQLRGRDDVVGVGVSRAAEGYCLKVNVRDGAAAEHLPTSVDGVDVAVAVVGRISAQS